MCAALLATAAQAAGLHTIYTYIAPYLALLNIGENYLPVALALFGIGGFSGSLLGGWAADRFGTWRVLVGSATGALTLIYAAPAALGVAAASLTLLALALLIAEQRCGKSKMPARREALQRAADGHAS
jgi:DHA1 family inner membrane transport protein